MRVGSIRIFGISPKCHLLFSFLRILNPQSPLEVQHQGIQGDRSHDFQTDNNNQWRAGCTIPQGGMGFSRETLGKHITWKIKEPSLFLTGTYRELSPGGKGKAIIWVTWILEYNLKDLCEHICLRLNFNSAYN